MSIRNATKSESEKQDEWSSSRVKPNSKKKPPRYDRRRRHYREDDPDLNMKKERKDLSMKAHIALDRAIVRIALSSRGVDPDYGDVLAIRASLPVDLDIKDPMSWPVVAAATHKRLDATYKQARYTRVRPSIDGRTFDMGEPLPDRRLNDANWPIWPQTNVHTERNFTAADYDDLLVAAQERLDSRVLEHNRDGAYRKALDEAIGDHERGKFQGKVDAPTYLALLNVLSGANYDLVKETYIPTEVNEQRRAERTVFDHTQYWGRPADSHIDSDQSKGEKWRDLFEFGKAHQYDTDEPYMKRFTNPKV